MPDSKPTTAGKGPTTPRATRAASATRKPTPVKARATTSSRAAKPAARVAAKPATSRAAAKPAAAKPVTGAKRVTGAKQTVTAKPVAKRTTAKRASTAKAAPKAGTTNSTQPRTPVQQVAVVAERAVLVPLGATLILRDGVVSTVRSITAKFETRADVERELKRYERRGATARKRIETEFERQTAFVTSQLGRQVSLLTSTVTKVALGMTSLR